MPTADEHCHSLLSHGAALRLSIGGLTKFAYRWLQEDSTLKSQDFELALRPHKPTTYKTRVEICDVEVLSAVH